MARITKAKQKILGLNAPSDQMAAFGSCKTGTPVYTTDINALQTAAYEQGWQDATDNDFAPYREEMNGVQYGLSRQIAYLQQEGLGEWIDTVTYYKGSVVKVLTSDSQEWYESTEDENTGNDPTVKGSTHWKKLKFGGSGLEICDIGMALYVDETKGLRRYLNGQIIDRNTNTEAFFTRLQEITTLHPSLLCTEEEWQSAKTMSAFGQVGKFVFNYNGANIVSVRLPRVVNVQGLFDLQNLGMTVNAGLPNIEGSTSYITYINYANASGAFSFGSDQHNASAGNSTGPGRNLIIDASKSNPIYGKSTTVQPEAIQYPYFIQIATGSETENNIINDIELNNPYSLFDSKYSDHELNNLSWLKSEGQWNAKAVYTDAYDKLLKVYNGTETVEGLSVKLSTAEYTDYDFVLDTTDETFRLPLKNHTADDGNSVLTLYFYIGETVQNANLIDAGRIGEQLANKVDKNEVAPLKTSYVVDTYINGTSGYRIWSDGYCEQWGIFDRGSDVTTSGSFIITLLKSYNNTLYTPIAINGGNTSDGGYGWHIAVSDVSKTATSFGGFTWKYETSNRFINWETKGYIS